MFRVARNPYDDVVKILPRLVRYISMYVVLDTGTIDVSGAFIRTYTDPPTIVVGGTAHIPGGTIKAVHVNLYDANNERIGGFIGRFDAAVPEGEYVIQVVARIETSTYFEPPASELLLLARPIRVFDEYLKIPVLYIGSDRSYQAETVRIGKENVAGVLLIAKALIPRRATMYEADRYFTGNLADVVLRKPARAEPLHYTFAATVADEHVMSPFSGYKYFLSLGDMVTGIGRATYGTMAPDVAGDYYVLNKSELNPNLYRLFASFEVIDRERLGIRVGNSIIDIRMADIMNMWMVGGIEGVLYIDDRPFKVKLPSATASISWANCPRAARHVYCDTIMDPLRFRYIVRLPSKIIAEVPKCKSDFEKAREECKRRNLIEPDNVEMYGYWFMPPIVTFPWVDVYMHYADTASRFKLRMYVPLYVPFTDGVIRFAFTGRITVKVLPQLVDPDAFIKRQIHWELAEQGAQVYTASETITVRYRTPEECEDIVSQQSDQPILFYRPMSAGGTFACPPYIRIPAIEIPIRRNFVPLIIEYEPARVPLSEIKTVIDMFAYEVVTSKIGDPTTCEYRSDCLNDLAAEWVYNVVAPHEWLYSVHILRPDDRGTFTGYLPTVDGAYVAYSVSKDIPVMGENVDLLEILARGVHVPYTSGVVPYLAIDEEYRFILGQ